MAEPGSPAEVLIVGGGVAARETLMALRDPAGDRVRITLSRALYLYERGPIALPGPAPERFVDLEVPLETDDAAPVGG
jgi:hypothetical protein